ncbi:MAG: imidazoleglycerol-phosphate dehydratase HisB [Clostridia bacterium]|nr:imidazoleglycerol-phosphate dehydratase HisB [Clostridia bacterium]
MRTSTIARKTAETDVTLTLNLDGSGKADVLSGVGFLDHMLTLFAAHSGYNLTLRCTGDTQVDDHHSVEDIGICLGLAFAEAIGDKKGIARYGDILLPMDEALIQCAVDISGRAVLCLDLDLPAQKVGTFDTELCEEFLLSFVRNAGITLHIRQLAGRNTHHIIEGVFKALARTLAKATTVVGDAIPSTKGVLA